MESAVITLTKSAIKESRFDIRACGPDFFPSDAFGDSSQRNTLGNEIILLAYGLSYLVKTK